MNVRSLLLMLVLGVPAVGLLLFGPRGQVDVPAGRTVIHYWEKWSGVEAEAMQRIVNRFNATVGAQCNIWVDYNAVSNVDQRMLIATAGGDPPDLAGLFDYVMAQYAERGALLPLDELAREFGIQEQAFKPVWWQIGVYQGQLYALPSAPYTIALFYNRRLFREAGLDPDRPPQTLDELADDALRLTKYAPLADGTAHARGDRAARKIVQLGWTPSSAMLGWWHWVWPCFFDARLWDGRRFALDTPAGRAALEWIAAMRARMGVAEVNAFEATAGAIEGPQNPFLSERLAMVFQGPWLTNWVRKYTPQLDYGVAPFPSQSRARRDVFASADVFVIPRGARHPREAMTFLAYVLRQDVMEELCREHGKVSPFRTPGPEFYATHPNPYIRVFDELADSPDAFGYPKMPTWTEATAQLFVLLDSVLRGRVAPDDAVRDAQRKIDDIVAEYDAMAAKRKHAR